jgi:hypothetical protein
MNIYGKGDLTTKSMGDPLSFNVKCIVLIVVKPLKLDVDFELSSLNENDLILAK